MTVATIRAMVRADLRGLGCAGLVLSEAVATIRAMIRADPRGLGHPSLVLSETKRWTPCPSPIMEAMEAVGGHRHPVKPGKLRQLLKTS